MSFLFPLYVLGALAVAAPLVFHFFQRRPHGQQDFSSLMFLKPTPPKLTRRSRLSDLLLLLLRGLALVLLAIAFSRPFLRSTTFLDLDAPARSVALLVDTSASMRREQIWPQVEKTLQSVIRDLQPSDQVCLISFDREPTTLVSFEAWEEAEPARRIPLVQEQAKGLRPSWYTTQLATALITASDALLQQRLAEDLGQPLQIILVSDLQQGSDLEALQSYEWPEEIALDLRTVQAAKKTNASLLALPPEPSDTDASQVRILVRNEADSQRAQFQLLWQTQASKEIDVHVPPGQTRVVRVTQPPGGQQLSLQNDDNPFDNELYLTETNPQRKKLWYVGDDQPGDQQSLYFYLRQASLDTRSCEVTIEKLDDLTSLATATPEQTPLVVLSTPLQGSPRADLVRFVMAGGRVLFVVQASTSAEAGEFLAELMDLPDVQLLTPPETDYVLLANIDFGNPLFQPFADPRFSDFSKICFWSHRQLASSHEAPWTVVARFDSGFPALVQRSRDQGTVWVLTSGWQPVESQLAVSSKFVPLLHGMFGHAPAGRTVATSYEVGQSIPLTPATENTTVITPDGLPIALPPNADTFGDTDVPGIYEVRQADQQFSLAVNVPASESRTQPMLPDRLEQLSVHLGAAQSIEALEKQQRQMRNKELEGRQKLWRWGILAALCAIALETGLSRRRRPTADTQGVAR